jgi:hypothetical protein
MIPFNNSSNTAQHMIIQVAAFGGKDLKCAHKKDKKPRGGFLNQMFGGASKRRAPPSGADPSNLAGEEVVTEDDVLHIDALPDFGRRLSPADSELLIQYLTAPYIRIPLMLTFFNDAARMHALDSEDIQNVLDSVLFEPGPWQSVVEK